MVGSIIMRTQSLLGKYDSEATAFFTLLNKIRPLLAAKGQILPTHWGRTDDRGKP